MNIIDLENNGIQLHTKTTDSHVIIDWLVGTDLYRSVYNRLSTETKVFYGGAAPKSVL